MIEKVKVTPQQINISFFVNGEQQQLQVEATKRLVDILREDLSLTGSKISCEIGRCGACSVEVDGELVNSCLFRAYQLNGKSVTTIESLSRNGLHEIQQAFLKEGGFQCGYCTPGMIMAVKTLVEKNQKPTDEEILEALSGNICRCTGYAGIIRSVKKVVEAL